MMKIDYSTFEFGQRSHNWYGKIKLDDPDVKKEISVAISPADDYSLPDSGKAFLEFFLENYPKYKQILLEAILEYYQDRRDEYGIDDPNDPDMPEVNDVNTIKTMITFTGMKVRKEKRFGKNAFGFFFDCTWDPEEGIGIRMSEFNVDKIGIEGIAF